jgi:CO/xanthine dehydrogenase FAD-binding subunit
MNNFIYRKVKSPQEAIELLIQYKGKARILAGGTDLLINMKMKKIKPEILIDIKGIEEFQGIRSDGTDLFLGSLVSIREIETSKVIGEEFRLLSEAATHMGSIQTRNLATLGGNICNGSPAADMLPALLCLKAKVKIMSPKGEEFVALDDFFKDPGQTILPVDGLLAAVHVQPLLANTGCAYEKYSIRKAMDLPVINVAVALTVGGDPQTCQEIRIALGSVGPIPSRARRAEERLKGQKLNQDLIREVSEIASADANPITDIRASEEYRKKMAKVITQRAITQAWDAIRIPKERHEARDKHRCQ